MQCTRMASGRLGTAKRAAALARTEHGRRALHGNIAGVANCREKPTGLCTPDCVVLLTKSNWWGWRRHTVRQHRATGGCCMRGGRLPRGPRGPGGV
eukprot:10614185-Alexandrium_andersonii.AAC.1